MICRVVEGSAAVCLCQSSSVVISIKVDMVPITGDGGVKEGLLLGRELQNSFGANIEELAINDQSESDLVVCFFALIWIWIWSWIWSWIWICKVTAMVWWVRRGRDGAVCAPERIICR